MARELLIRRLGEHCFFPEVKGETPVGLGDDIKGDFGEVAQGGSAAPVQGIAVLDAVH